MNPATVEIPVAVLRGFIDGLQGDTVDKADVVAAMQSFMPKPPTEEYYVLYKVTWQPKNEEEREHGAPMDVAHDFKPTDSRVVDYGMYGIGKLEHIDQAIAELRA